jgi:hypothetical protein
VVDGAYRALPGASEDRLFSVVNALVAEVWTLRSHQLRVDAALTKQGIEVESYLDGRDGEPAELAAILEDRDAFIERVYRSLVPLLGEAGDS